jgi:hypothetical protein
MSEQMPPPPGAFEGRRRPPRSDPGRSGTILFGVILIVLGLWFFAERTLGIALPHVDWGSLWPVVLIGLGIWMLIGAASRTRSG